MTITTICETIMLICFGLSWPLSIAKSLQSKTAKGKSVFFQIAILVGYAAGITGKFAAGNYNYVTWLYVFNISMVAFDLFLYFRNLEADRKRAFDNKMAILGINVEEDEETKTVKTPLMKPIDASSYPEGETLQKAALEGLRMDEDVLVRGAVADTIEDDCEEGLCLASASLGGI